MTVIAATTTVDTGEGGADRGSSSRWQGLRHHQFYASIFLLPPRLRCLALDREPQTMVCWLRSNQNVNPDR
ncbi:hypothetical protein Taro_050200 [Colocasia esculenta]|uniref:Uncharacterized protein n=1 Tax=Colocasia esculenta TaxID=4460 RepID=A0A843XD72_COLES|nr:hypothetical protein [Colocasia esculenta]